MAGRACGAALVKAIFASVDFRFGPLLLAEIACELSVFFTVFLLHWRRLGFGLTVACGGRGPGTDAAVAGRLRARTRARRPARAATAPLRRLTAEHYRNSVRDLLGVVDRGHSVAARRGDRGVLRQHPGAGVRAAARAVRPRRRVHRPRRRRACQSWRQLHAGAPKPRWAARPAADAFIERFGRQVYRRPLERRTNARALAQLYQQGQALAGPVAGLKLVVQALLASPHFLYLVEPAPQAQPGRAGRAWRRTRWRRGWRISSGARPRHQALLDGGRARGLATRGRGRAARPLA